MAPEGVDARLAEQVAYYRARAPEYDDWWERRHQYDFGPEFEAQWAVEVAAVQGALDRFGPTGDVLELAAGTGIFTARLLAHADRVTAVASPEALAPRGRVWFCDNAPTDRGADGVRHHHLGVPVRHRRTCAVTAGAVASPPVLIVHATIDVDPDHHDAVLAAAATQQDLCRAEAGCHRYDISGDVADRGRFYVTELWEDDDALAAHSKQPHMRDFGRALRDAGLKGSTATKYTITGETKLF